jgi:hypothetical protein
MLWLIGTYIVLSFGKLPPFWYVVSRNIWQPGHPHEQENTVSDLNWDSPVRNVHSNKITGFILYNFLIRLHF